MSEKQLWEKVYGELTPEERNLVENNDNLYLTIYNNTVDRMYEITDEMKKFMIEYPYRSQDEIRDPKKIKVMAHYFNPAAEQDWIITENYDYQNGEHYFYGCARLFDDIGWEWGVLPSLEELKSIDLGPAYGHLRIEKDETVSVGDSLYEVMNAIDKDGLYDLGLMQRKFPVEMSLIDIEKAKGKVFHDLVDEETYYRCVNYMLEENGVLDDFFDFDKYYYDQGECFDRGFINNYYKTHEFPGIEAVCEKVVSMPEAETGNEYDMFKPFAKSKDFNFGKEM